MYGIIASIVVSHCKKKFSSLAQMVSHGGHIDALYHMNIQSQKTKTPWLFWPLALKFVVMVSQHIEDSRSKHKAPAVVFIGGVQWWMWQLVFRSLQSLLALLFLTARKKLSSWAQMMSYGVHIGTLCHLKIQSQKTKTPWLFLAVGFEFRNYGEPAY